MLLAQSESLAYVRDQLGHASISITVNQYGHLTPGANRGAVDRLDDAALDVRVVARGLPIDATKCHEAATDSAIGGAF
jgi:hypothetical protein